MRGRAARSRVGWGQRACALLKTRHDVVDVPRVRIHGREAVSQRQQTTKPRDDCASSGITELDPVGRGHKPGKMPGKSAQNVAPESTMQVCWSVRCPLHSNYPYIE